MLQSQETVWFFSERLTSQHTENLDGFIKRFSDFTQTAQFVWTNRSDVRLKNLESKRNCIALVFTTGGSDPVMTVHNRVMTGRHFGMSIVVYVSKVTNVSEVEPICYTLYKGNFVNAMVHFETTSGLSFFYGYQMYPTFKMEDRTDFQAYVRKQYQKVIAASQDVGGYRFYTPMRQDLPHVIKFNNTRGREEVKGTTFQILQLFVDSLNGSLVEYQMPADKYGRETVDMKSILEMVRKREIDMSVHAYALYRSDDDLDKSYPIMVVKWCLMVPLENSISTFLYPVQPFEWRVWLLILAVLVLLQIMDFWRILLRTKLHGERHKLLSLLSNAWLDDFCHVLGVSASSTIQASSWLRFIYYMALYFFCFFLSANYCSYLGSFLTVTLFREQINSIDDLISAQLPVMVVDYELEFLTSEGYEMPQQFRKLLRPVDTATFAQHQMRFNTSFAYFVTEDAWHFLDETQKHLKQRIFKFSDICFGSYHLAYPIQTDSAVWRDLEYFLFRTHSNGLIHKYEHEAIQYSLRAGYVQRLVETHEYTSAGMEHLTLLFIICGSMTLVGGLCLCGELLLHSYG